MREGGIRVSPHLFNSEQGIDRNRCCNRLNRARDCHRRQSTAPWTILNHKLDATKRLSDVQWKCWMVTLPLSFRLCAPGISFFCRDAWQTSTFTEPHVVANGVSELFFLASGMVRLLKGCNRGVCTNMVEVA